MRAAPWRERGRSERGYKKERVNSTVKKGSSKEERQGKQEKPPKEK